MSDLIFAGDRDFLAQYLRDMACEVGLRDWWIDLTGQTPQERGGDDDFGAMCEVVPGQKRAKISFCAEWAEADPFDLRQTCVHELLHCHFDALHKPWQAAEDMLGRMVFTPLFAMHLQAVEFALDSLAYEWARYLPLPGEWLERATEPEVAW